MHPAHPGDKACSQGSEVRGQRSEVRGQRSEIRSPNSNLAAPTTHHSSLITDHSSLFTHHFFSTPAGSRTQTSTFGGSRDVRFTTRARRPEIRSQRSEVGSQPPASQTNLPLISDL